MFISGKLGSASVDFGGGVVVDGLTTGEEYGYVARLDGATGTGKWARVFRATSPAYVDLVAVRGGHVAIAGRFAGTLTYAAAGVDGGSAMTADALGTRNAWFASLDPATGLVRWFVRASTTGSGTDAETLAVDENGEVYGTVTFSNAPLQGLGAARPPIGMVDLALFRLAGADGSPVWVKQLANAQQLGILAPRHLSLAGTGPLLLAGSLRGDLDLGLGTLSVPTGDRAALFVALDRATGAATWQRLHTFPESSMRGDVMRSAPAGDLLVAASYTDPSSNNPIPVVEVEGRSLPDPEGGQGSYAIRYAADGTAKWTRVVVPIPGAQNNPNVRINDLVALPSGPVIAAGSVFGRADLGSGVPTDGPLGISGITIWAWPP